MTWQPFGGAGYFVLVLLLALATAAALALIVAPLAVRGVETRRGDAVKMARRIGGGDERRAAARLYGGRLRISVCWASAFLFVEIPLVQQYILLVGRPTLALAVVLFSLLTASGAGSLLSRRVPWRLGAVLLTVAIVAYPSLIRALSMAILAAPLEVRMIAGGLVLLPLGLLMGVMFPRGIAYLEGAAPGWVPWAWGINGAASVISSVASALLALSLVSQR